MAVQNTAAPANKVQKRSYFQMRKTALDNSTSKNEQAMEDALRILREFVLNPKNAELVWLSAKVAHSAAGMTEQECIDCLVHLGKKPTVPKSGAGTALKDDPDALDLSKDIYRQLGLQEWVKYLYYGGERKIGTDANGNVLYAEDQNVVMHYFGIETNYKMLTSVVTDRNGNVVRDKDGKEQTRKKWVLWCDYSKSLSPMIDLRNKFAGHTNVTKEESLQLSVLMGYYTDLLACLKPLTDTRWTYRNRCQEMMEQLKKDFYGALGVRTYQVADIMNMMYTNKPDKWLLSGEQPQMENLLTNAGMQVSGGAVDIAGELNDFLPVLEEAWRYYKLCEISGVEQLKQWLYEQNLDGAKQNQPEDKTAAALADGSPADWTELADRYLHGVKGVERDPEQAKAWYEKAATAASPDPKAMYVLGQIYEQQESVIARQYYRMAADKGYLPALVWMGIACEDGLCGQPRNWKEAFAWYEKAAKHNDVEGLCRLGLCYEAGRGVEQDKKIAATYYKLAQSKGSEAATIHEASLRLSEEGEESDKAAALETLRALAENAVPLAQAKLGACYLNGWGVTKDYAKGYAYVHEAAEAGDRTGQYWTGWCCYNLCMGNYDPGYFDFDEYDYEAAAKWSLKAALQGHVGAQLQCEAYVPQKAQWLTEIAQQASGKEAEEAVNQIIEERFDGWVHWAELAAENNAILAVNLAKWYLDKQIKKALEYFELAAANDYKIAWNLITFYQCGKTTVEFEKETSDNQSIPQYIQLQSNSVIDPQRALYWLEKIGHAGDIVACRKLAQYYLEDKPGKKKDPERAMYWYEQEGQRVPKAYCKIAEILLEGKLVDRDVKKAAYWYDYAGKQGYHEAYRILAKHCLDGNYVKQNRETAILYYKKGLEQAIKSGNGFEADKQQVTVMKEIDPYLQPEMPIEVVQAACTALEDMVQCNWEQAMIRLGHCYLTRKDLSRSPQEGIRWLIRAYEEHEEMDAAFILATIYREGILVPQDLKRSLYWLEVIAPDWDLVCENEEFTNELSPQYQYVNGGLYSYGELGFQVRKNGGGWYLVAQCYDKGLGTRENQVKAFECYHKAWEEGYLIARNELRRRYEQGIGVKRDPDMAQKIPYNYKDLAAPSTKIVPGRCFYRPGVLNEIAEVAIMEAEEQIHADRVQRLKEERAKRNRGK